MVTVLIPAKYVNWFQQYTLWVSMWYPEVIKKEQSEDDSLFPD